ncbi:MAG: hypothetical protein AB7R55_19275 [Gemmatimonadales bacterium]
MPDTIRRIEDERVPAGLVGLASYLEERMIARCAVPEEVARLIAERGLFDQPVQLVLAARTEEPGLQCRLFAIVDMGEGEDEDGEREPWADSVPGAGFDSESEDEPSQAMVFLGQVVRFRSDRKHPDDLALETADVLRRIVEGQAVEVVDKVLRDLLGDADV